jgi:predicted P-loop ATPase
MTTARKRLTVVDSGNSAGATPPGGGSPEVDAWKRLLTANKEGRIESTLHNVLLILEHDVHFSGLFWLNESSNQVVLSRDPPWTSGTRDEFTDADSCELAAWLQHPDRYAMSVGDDLALKGVVTVARRHRRHPIRDYLHGLRWDGTPRVQRMLVDLFGAEDRTYNLQSAMCFMVGAVARVLFIDPKQPNVGAKVDFMLVLEDKQGQKKTTAFQTLFGAAWFVETMESPQHNDFYQILQGCWGVEIAEMDSFSKADVTRVKGAITRLTDKYRAPYERAPRSWRRECIFVGTTNETEWLRDPTGGRRFLPVRLMPSGKVDIERIDAERDQLWAEAVRLFLEGFQYWVLPDDAAVEQEQRFIEDSWEGRIARWLAGRLVSKSEDRPYPSRLGYGTPVDWTTTDEILLYAIGMDAGKHGRPEQMRVAAIMKRLGWEHVRREWAEGEGRERRWVRLESAELSAGVGKRGGRDDDPPF